MEESMCVVLVYRQSKHSEESNKQRNMHQGNSIRRSRRGPAGNSQHQTATEKTFGTDLKHILLMPLQFLKNMYPGLDPTHCLSYLERISSR